jgi:hypothetical protein
MARIVFDLKRHMAEKVYARLCLICKWQRWIPLQGRTRNYHVEKFLGCCLRFHDCPPTYYGILLSCHFKRYIIQMRPRCVSFDPVRTWIIPKGLWRPPAPHVRACPAARSADSIYAPSYSVGSFIFTAPSWMDASIRCLPALPLTSPVKWI